VAADGGGCGLQVVDRLHAASPPPRTGTWRARVAPDSVIVLRRGHDRRHAGGDPSTDPRAAGRATRTKAL